MEEERERKSFYFLVVLFSTTQNLREITGINF
jgi:hypothetical protein